MWMPSKEPPKRALRAMAVAAEPRGRILIWVYGLEKNRRIAHLSTPLREFLFRRLPVALVHHLSLYPTALPWSARHLAIGRIEYFRLARRLTFKHLRSIVFDQMLPGIAHFWSRAELERLMPGTGLAGVRLAWLDEMSRSAIGRRSDEEDAGRQTAALLR